MVLSTPTSWTSTWPKSHLLVTLLLIYSVTRRRCSSLRDDILGTTVHNIPCLEWHHCHLFEVDMFDVDMLQTKAGFRVRLHAKRGLCTRLGNDSQSLPISGSWSCHLVHCSPRLRLLEFLKSPFMHRRLRLLWTPWCKQTFVADEEPKASYP